MAEKAFQFATGVETATVFGIKPEILTRLESSTVDSIVWSSVALVALMDRFGRRNLSSPLESNRRVVRQFAIQTDQNSFREIQGDGYTDFDRRKDRLTGREGLLYEIIINPNGNSLAVTYMLDESKPDTRNIIALHVSKKGQRITDPSQLLQALKDAKSMLNEHT